MHGGTAEAKEIAAHERGWRVGWALILLAMPIIASTISRTAMSFVDFIMVSQLGAEAQAAVLPAGLLLFTGIGFGLGLLSVTNTFVAQSLGRRDPRSCASYTWQGVWLSAGLALLGLPAWFVVDDLFAWVGHDPDVQAMETIYVRIGLLGLFPMLASAALSNFFTGIHRPAIGFWAMLGANLFNVAANYALIYGHWGFPRLGIAGAAIATQLAAVVQTLILFAWMARPAIAREFEVWRTWRPDVRRLVDVVKVGTPAGLHFSMDIGGFMAFTVLIIGRFGTVQLAAHNVVMKVFEASFMPTIGLGIALTAAVGKAIGEGNAPQARRIAAWGAGIGIAYMGAVAVGVVAFRHPLAAAMAPEGEAAAEVIAWTVRLLVVCTIYQVFDALFIVHVHALRGAGDVNVPALIAGGLAITLLLGGGWYAAAAFPQYGVLGPWVAGVVYVIAIGLGMTARWVWGPWERIDLFKRDRVAPMPTGA